MCKSFKNFCKVSGDYSSYDQTIPSFLIQTSFDIIKGFYNFDNKYQSSLYDKMVKYVIHGPIYHPDIGIINRKRGIASGSVFTNLVDSICNLLIVNYTNRLLGLDLAKLYVCGDDNLMLTSGRLIPDYFGTIIKKVFNMDFEFEHGSRIQKGVQAMQFLGSYWSEDGPHRTVKRMILSACKQS